MRTLSFDVDGEVLTFCVPLLKHLEKYFGKDASEECKNLSPEEKGRRIMFECYKAANKDASIEKLSSLTPANFGYISEELQKESGLTVTAKKVVAGI